MLKEKLKEILNEGDYCNLSKISKGYELAYGKTDCGEAPMLNFKILKALGELFGTDEIDVDDYCNSGGCDTCDYGSDFGHTIQIMVPTKYVDELHSLVGQKLF